MGKLFFILAVISVTLVFITGSGAFLISNKLIAQSKVDAVSAVAKGVALALSVQVNLLNSMLDKMVQDPEVINAAAQKNSELLEHVGKKIAEHFPGILSVKFLLPEDKDPASKIMTDMSFADLEMAKQTFNSDQKTAIQGDGTDRHLAIARRIVQNNATIGVALVGVRFDFIEKIMSTTILEKGQIQLRQDKLILSALGEKKDTPLENSIPVPNTNWELYYDNSTSTSLIELSLIVGIVLIPALMVMLGFVISYRKLSELLSEDLAWLLKAFKDILTEKPVGNYPIKLNEISVVVPTLVQFKRVVKGKWFDI